MRLSELLVIIVLSTGLPACFFYLLFCLKKYRQLTALSGLFCLTMGFFLLVLDLVLISFTLGTQYIPDYLLFNRLVSDSGFAGRWILTVYVFFSAGLVITIYLLARNLIRKFNEK